MKAIFRKIWETALPYQDKRDDKGHAKIVLDFALEFVKKEKADENVVIPAAILHDLGWSTLPKKESLSIFRESTAEEKIVGAIRKHEIAGVKLAGQILKRVGYPPGMVEEVLEIVSQHDTRVGFISKNEGVVRDADKLWRFSRTGYGIDVKRSGDVPAHLYLKMKAQIEEKGFFYSERAKKLARLELEKRKEEFGID